jgi:tetrahydromethanopterin S-methyltransferase subunit E
MARLFQSAEFGAGAAEMAQGDALQAEVAGITNAMEADAFVLKQEAEMHVRRMRHKA